MELDLDAFLASQTSTDDEISDDDVPHRTVDEILNDSSSSYSPPSPVGSPKTLSNSRATEIVKSVIFDEANLRFSSITPANLGKDSSLLGQSVLHPFPPLFGGARSSTKPGAALAAAAAASRSVATPHAAAMKLRKAGSLTLGKIAGVGEPPPSGFASEVSRSEGKSPKEAVQCDNLDCSSSEKAIGFDDNGEFPIGDEVRESEGGIISSIREMPIEPEQSELSMVDASDEIVSDPYSDQNTMHNLEVEQVPVSLSLPQQEDSRSISQLIDVSESTGDGVNSSAGRIANELAPGTVEFEDYAPLLDDELSFTGGESSSVREIMDLVEDTLGELEINDRRTQGTSFSSMNPFEVAEELEKKQAFSGLDWENGIAAQPMRLEGVRRGSTVLGYFDVRASNIITRTISSQAFRRDQGSPQVVAVHLNFIAVGLSKGLILVVPSKYSPHSADNMDGKILMLGLQGDISHSPVTSICFNQQGDLLFAGYGDGHVNVWDVLKGTSVKLITGIHEAPVVHMLYLGHDSQATRKFKVVSGDSKGLVWLITFSTGAWVNRFSFSTVCLLDGKTTGKVLCASPLLLDESCGGALMSSQGNTSGLNSGIGSMMGGVLGGDAGWKLSNEKSFLGEEGVVILGTYQSALVARVSPTVTVYAQLSKPEGVREGSMPYTAWKCMGPQHGSVTDNTGEEASEKVSLLAIAWDRKVQVAKFVKSELKIYGKWTLESSAIGVAWLDDQMLVVLTSNGQLCLFAKDGTLIHQTSFAVDESRDDLVAYHTQFTNIFGNPEKAYHNSIAIRGASIYILGPMHLVVCRLLPWKERIQVLRKAGDWMGALNMAMTLFDGQAHGVIDLPRSVDAVQEAIMPFLVELLLSYVDEVFSYISVAFCNQIEKLDQLDDTERQTSSVHLEIKEQFSRVGGVAVEFCVHIKRKDVLFDEILSKFVAVQHRDTFLELLEPYILKDMLGSLPPEVMQALVEHYSTKGWLQRIEQCVLHMDISSLDFNQVVRLCREHRLYGALIYLFNKGLDDFRAPLEELLVVLQNSEKDKAASLGFRMLVYLKYCFTGLAFPPGHGTLPPERLPSLRTELVQFLLESSAAPNSLSMAGFMATEAYRNIYYLLQLDTEATLDVLRCAFLEDETPTSVCSQGSTDKEVAGDKDSEPCATTQNPLVQKVLDALIYILDKSSFETKRSTDDGEIKALEVWPSKKDVGLMLEFIAYYVSCKKAKVPNSTLYQILEYLTSDIVLQPSIPSQNLETARKRQKQVLALLEIVSDTDWDASSVLNLCERVQFYQACGFIYTIEHQYFAALDSYMKDEDEPIHMFSFINDALQRLTGPQADSFRSTVISQIPQLTIICRQPTFFLVNDHFRRDYEHILAQLRSHPKSLFLYLKTVFEIHLSGTLDFSCLNINETAEFCSGRARDQSIQTYLEKVSEFPKFLRNNPVQVTDEMVELYFELLCQHESSSVLKFLETFENYRVEYCLRLCQEHGIRDAAAFLLERVGDVGSALLLTLSGLDEKFVMLDTAVDSAVSNAEVKTFSAAVKKEVNDIFDILHACIGLCQRNTLRLIPDESETLWFQLLDTFCEPLKGSITGKAVSDGENSVSAAVSQEAVIIKWKIMKTNKGRVGMLREIFSQFIKAIVEGMIGYIRLPTIMSKLLSDNGGQEFGDFKVTILGMLGTYGFERRILDTAKSLIEDDTFYTMSLLKKGACHGYAPQSPLCCLCNCGLVVVTKKPSSSAGIRVFNCGHASHIQCQLEENGMTTARTSTSTSFDGCPVCIPKNVGQHKIRSKSIVEEENGLVVVNSRSPPREVNNSLHPHESDASENSCYGGASQVSRFEILNNLGKDQKKLIINLDNLPALRLAPPAVYHEKVKKGFGLDMGGGGASSSSSSAAKSEKPTSKSRQLKDLKVMGSAFRLPPLRSNVFGKERSNRR